MIFAVNILQFIFLSLKLDNIVEWSWVVCNQCIIVLIYLCIIDMHSITSRITVNIKDGISCGMGYD